MANSAKIVEAISRTEKPKRNLSLVREDFPQRPRIRAECEAIERPCPFVSCRYHLFLEVKKNGNIQYNFPGLEPDQLTESCALDVAEDGEHTLLQISNLIGRNRERARQLEAVALRKLATPANRRLTKEWK